MAVNRVPVLKRCRSLGLEPAYLGYDKKSNRTARTGKKMSEYGLQLREKQKAKFIFADPPYALKELESIPTRIFESGIIGTGAWKR